MTALKVVLALGIVQAVYALNTTQLCDILPENTSFRDSTICSKYYTCKNNKPVEGNCLGGLFFDTNIGKCNDKKKVKCSEDMDIKCENKNSQYLPDPQSCENYYLCVNGKARSLSCPSGINFNPRTSSCDYNHEYNCRVSEKDYNLCETVPKNTLFKHPENCKKYRTCVDESEFVERTCPGSLWFNSVTGKCDTEENSKCKEEPVFQPSNPEIGKICGSNSRPFIGLVHDGETCRGYYDCKAVVDNHGKQILNVNPTYYQCNKTEIFDEKTRKCQSRLTTKCRFDRCDGWNNEFINIQGDGCQGYIMCENNKEFMKMSCPDNYYFDEQKQDCITSVVSYPSCAK